VVVSRDVIFEEGRYFMRSLELRDIIEVLVVEPDYLPDSEVLCFSAVFIPHEDFTPQKYVHSSTRGSAEGGYPLCGVRGGYPPEGGGKVGGVRGEAPEGKIAL
jgi:hypothetical protein